jgi:hypothetical protein
MSISSYQYYAQGNTCAIIYIAKNNKEMGTFLITAYNSVKPYLVNGYIDEFLAK